MFKAPRLVSRPKPPVQQEEEMGSEIKLGDFEDVHALSVSEARAVVTAVHLRLRLYSYEIWPHTLLSLTSTTTSALSSILLFVRIIAHNWPRRVG